MEIFYTLFAVLFGIIFGAAISYAIVEIRRDIQNSKPKSNVPFWIGALSNNIPDLTGSNNYYLLNYYKRCKKEGRNIASSVNSRIADFLRKNTGWDETVLIDKFLIKWQEEEDNAKRDKYADEFYGTYTGIADLKKHVEKRIQEEIIRGKCRLIVVHSLMLPFIVANGLGNVAYISEEKGLNVKGVRIIGSKNINLDEVIVL